MPDLPSSLASRRNPDGGWGYEAGKTSRLEPTCWALLALARASAQPLDADVLLEWRQESGWFVDVPGVPVNFAFNALAALTLRTHPRGRDTARRIATQLLGVHGLAFEPSPALRQDNSLQAWPWIDGTFSWVEPTSLCLLLMKRLRRELPATAVSDRITVAERMLLDRACAPGGWNYGGANAFGRDLFPYVPTTALGLLAMQDRKDLPVTRQAVNWLAQEAASEKSTQSLALAGIALTAYRSGTTVLGEVRRRLPGESNARATLGLACGLYAAARPEGGFDAFAV